jgi:hypothetical protein
MTTLAATDVVIPAALFASVPGEAVRIAAATPIALPDDFSSNQHGDTRFTALFARLPEGGELRSVHIHGARIEIINLFHFPAPYRALPVYAMEFVMFGRRPVVGVIDAKALAPHPYATTLWRRTLESAHTFFPQLTRADDPPDWYQDCRSGLDFFTRPDAADGMATLLACHAFVWKNLSAAGALAPKLDTLATAAHALALAEYKTHHRLNSPGLPFLHRTFGSDWTDRFLSKALFA